MRTLVTVLSAIFVSVPAFADSPSTPHSSATHLQRAVLAGGCFWCMESDFEKLDGVVDVVPGYTGGYVDNPTYEQVSTGGTGHVEAVEVTFDADKITYPRVLDYFWHHIDPTQDDGQFCDQGPQYRPVIFYTNDSQHQQALASAQQIAAAKPFPEPLKVEITKASTFYPAEKYHQDYYRKNPVRYRLYRFHCGRDARLEALWGKSD
jgi:methionine-S-sulfoxide reductase